MSDTHKNKRLALAFALTSGFILAGYASLAPSHASELPRPSAAGDAAFERAPGDQRREWYEREQDLDIDRQSRAEILEVWDEETATTASLSEPELDGDIWDHLRNGFALTVTEHPRIAAEIRWYARHRSYFDRVAERAQPYLHHIVEQIDARGMPREIALLPVVESAFQPYAYSPGRAAGLWQIVPATARRFGLRLSWWYDGRRDVVASTEAALDYLDYLHNMFEGDWLLALAAYNSGEGTVLRAIRKNKRRGKPTDYWSLSLPRETKAYVPRLLAVSTIVAQPDAHGILLESIPNEPYLTTVEVGTQIDLSIAAELADMEIEEFYRLNPGFNRGATDPAGPHYLALPIDRAVAFQERLARLPKEEWVQWMRHRVRSGETLSHIAVRYRTNVRQIKALNLLKSNTIRAGHYLMVPVSSRGVSSHNDSRSADDAVVHTIVNGDTLWDIAKKYDVTVKQLAAWNGIAPGQHLYPGKTLRVELSNATRSGSRMGGPPKVERKITYVVRRGDSLARISKRFNVSVNQLVRWNRLNKRKYLKPGQRLKLIVDVTRVAESS